MSSWVNRTVLSGSSIVANGTTSHTCTFTAATSGNLLVAVVAGAVTFTTPSGWTLLTSAIAASGLYVFTKTASASESSFSTTHNNSNFEIRGMVYEFPALCTVIGTAGFATNQAATVTGPNCTGLTGTYTRFAARSWDMANTDTTGTAAWTTPGTEDYDTYAADSGTTDGIALSIAYDDNCNSPSFTPSSAYTIFDTGIVTGGEGVSFAIATPNWLNRTVLSGSSTSANGTTSHTCTFTAATSGNLLVAVVAGAVTFTTPSGWTLQTFANNVTGLYLFTKTASASESSFTTTHNGSDYAIKGVVYEYPAGTSCTASNSQANQSYVATTPSITGLSGTYTRFAARSLGMGTGATTASTVWVTPAIEDYDSFVLKGTNGGVSLTIAYDDGRRGTAYSPSSTITSDAGGSGEAIIFTLYVPNVVPVIAYIQGNNIINSASAPSIAQSFTSSVTAGSLLIVAGSYASTSLTATVSDSMGNTYTKAAGPQDNATLGFRDYIFYAIAGSTGSNTVTLTPSSSTTFTRLLIHEYAGVDTLDVIAGANGATGAIDSGLATTHHANELLFGWGISNNGTTTPGTGYTLRQTSGSESTEDFILSAIGSYNASYPNDSSPWICQMATFYLAPPTLFSVPYLRF